MAGRLEKGAVQRNIEIVHPLQAKKTGVKSQNLLADERAFPTFPPPGFFGNFASAAVMWSIVPLKSGTECSREPHEEQRRNKPFSHANHQPTRTTGSPKGKGEVQITRPCELSSAPRRLRSGDDSYPQEAEFSTS